jgi:hypothetical protein
MTIFHQQGVQMKFFSKLISQILIASMVLLPFTANAGMIATDQVVASAAAQANRDKVLGFVARADVQKQMETLGLTPANAADRVNAMTDEEVQRVAGKIDSLPAGAMSSAGWWGVGIVIIGLIVWYVYK